MKHQALRPIALMLSVLLIAAAPAQAGSIRFGDVISLATINGQSGRQTLDLRLRSVDQSGRSNSQDAQKPTAAGDNAQDRKNVQGPSAAPLTGGAGNAAGETVVIPQSGSTQVETIELGDVQGTICDCGEIFIPKGGFPKLPLLALAGIPLLFIPFGDDEPPPSDILPTPTPTPTTTAPEVPEPATLFLLGSGLVALGAGARRRRSLRQVAQEIETLKAREV